MITSKRVIMLLTTGLLFASCSPYVYQDEVRGFSKGVGDLATAFQGSQTAVDTAARAADRARWASERAVLGLSPGCVVGEVTQGVKAPCTLLAAGEKPREPSLAQRTAAEAGPIVEALEEYAEALSAIVDATDRVALEKAQGDLKEKVVGLAERTDAPSQGTAADRVGAVVGLFNRVAATELGRRRYEALRAGVVGADSAVAELGPVVGKALALLSAARVALVRDEAQTLEDGLSGPALRALSEEQYRRRMDALDAKADEIRSLITADPEAAARKMVEAHTQLRKTLEAPSTQIEVVFKAIKTFVEEARAVRAALADEPGTAGKGA